MRSLSSSSVADAAAELLDRRQARNGLLAFGQYLLPEYQTPPHIRLLGDMLEQVERGQISRLIVTMPPRHGKSMLISEIFPCWCLGRHPNWGIVQAGYADSIAIAHSRRARDLFGSPEMHHLFPDVSSPAERPGAQNVAQRQAAHEWATAHGGSYYAVGIGGGLTGRGYDIGIIDDPVKDAAEAASPLVRENIYAWYRTVFRTRAAPGAAIILVMTRWHQDDLSGRLLRLADTDPSADQWQLLHLPAIASGQALWPERYSLEALESIRTTIGSASFASLYQGAPEIEGGNIVRREWWQYYRERPQCPRIVHSWDTAYKGGAGDDWSVCTVWGEADTGYYLIDLWRGRVEFPELKRQAVALNDRDRPAAILVEDAASGQSLIQELRRGTSLPVLPVRPDRDKVTRLAAVTPLIEAGKVMLPERAPWLADYIDEMAAFPSGEHDDQVDSTSQALGWLALQRQGANPLLIA